MHKITFASVALLLGTLWTYAVPELRMESVFGPIPYAVLFVVVMILLQVAKNPVLLVTRDLGNNLALIFYLLGTLLSTLNGQVNGAVLFKVVCFPVSMLALARAIQRREDVGRALMLLCASAIIILAYGAYGYVTWKTGDPQEHEFGYFAVTYMPSTRNGDQMYFLTGSVVALAILIGSQHRTRRRFTRLLAPAVYIIFTVAITMSYCRSAWLTVFVVAIVVYTACANRHAKHRLRPLLNATLAFALLGLVVAVALSIFGNQRLADLQDRLSSMFTMEERRGGNSNLYRLDLLKQAVDLAISNPMGIGVGAASSQLVVDGQTFGNHAENGYLQLFLEQGIITLGAFLFLLGRMMRSSFIAARQVDSDWIDVCVFGLAVTMAIYLIFNNLIENIWFWLCLGVVLAHTELRAIGGSARTDDRSALLISRDPASPV